MRRFLSILSLLLPTVALAAPSGLVHAPVASATMGEEIPLVVEVAGVPDGEPVVRVHWRGSSAMQFSRALLASVGGGRYEGVIPASATQDLALRYFIEVVGPKESYQLALGSQSQPLTISLEEPVPPQTAGATTTIAIACGVAGLIALGLRWRRATMAKAVREQIFWARNLYPVTQMARAEQHSEIRRLTGTPLNHPEKGMTLFPRATLLKKLKEVQEMDIDELVELRHRHLGREAGVELPAMKPKSREGDLVSA